MLTTPPVLAYYDTMLRPQQADRLPGWSPVSIQTQSIALRALHLDGNRVWRFVNILGLRDTTVRPADWVVRIWVRVTGTVFCADREGAIGNLVCTWNVFIPIATVIQTWRSRLTIDHYLGFVSKKALSAAPKRLQRMLLRLQRYNYKLVYKPGSQLILADAFVSSYAGKRHRLSPAKMNQTKFDKETVRKETQNCCMVTDVTTYPYEMVTDLNISVGLSYWSTKQCCEQNFCLFVPTCHILGVHKSQMMQEIEFTFKCLSPVYVALYPPFPTGFKSGGHCSPRLRCSSARAIDQYSFYVIIIIIILFFLHQTNTVPVG